MWLFAIARRCALMRPRHKRVRTRLSGLSTVWPYSKVGIAQPPRDSKALAANTREMPISSVMIWAVAKRPGWPEDRCYTDVLTEDVNSGEAFSYTGICE